MEGTIMSNKVLVTDSNLTNIANIIREKSGKSEGIQPINFANEIRNLPTGDTTMEDSLIKRDKNLLEYSNDKIIELRNGAFAYSDSSKDWALASINLPNLTRIGDSTFRYNTVLKTLNTPKVTSIGPNAFTQCTIESLSFPELITAEPSAFYYSRTKNLSLPKLSSIGDGCFEYCSCQILELPSLTSVGSRAFASSSLREITIPLIDTIYPEMFSGCKSLTTVNMPIKYLSGNLGFNYCTSLQSLDLPNVISLTGSQMFKDCSELISVDMPKATSISGYSIFEGCPKLTNINIPNVETLNGNRMFRECPGLKIIDLPKVTYIGGYDVFYKCTGLLMLILRSDSIVQMAESSNFSSTPISDGTGYIYVPKALINDYKKATNWSRYASQFKTIEDLSLSSIEIKASNSININTASKKSLIEVTYNNGMDFLLDPEQMNYTISVEGNAIVDGQYVVLTENAQEGDKIIVTVTSTYDTNIMASKEIDVVFKDKELTIELNNGQWVDSGTVASNGNIIYKSDANSYNINNGKSIARINASGYTKIQLFIRSYAESVYDYTEAFAADTLATRGAGLFTTKSKSSQTEYIECNYELSGAEHFIEIMYSKDSSANSNDDRGYFYLGEIE